MSDLPQVVLPGKTDEVYFWNNYMQKYFRCIIQNPRLQEVRHMFNQVIHKLKTVSLWHFVWIAIVLSEIFISIMSVLFKGKVAFDDLIAGGIVSLFVAYIVIYLVKQLRETGKSMMGNERLAREAIQTAQIITEADKEAMANEFLKLEVSERKRAENELKIFSQRMETIINSSPDFIILKDKDFRFLLINEQCGKFFKTSVKDAIGKTSFDFMPKETAELCQKGDEEALKSDSPVHSEELIGDRWFHVVKQKVTDSEGNISGIVAIIRDITERKHVEESILESEEYFRGIVNAAKDAIVHINNNGKIVFWNNAAEEIFGYTAQETIGREAHLFLAPQKFHEAYLKGFNRFREAGQGPAVGGTHKFTAVKKDGTEFPVEVSVSAIRIKGNWHAIGIIRDTTKQKRMEEELLRSQKLESVGVLAGGIAHDFNNALTGILGNISIAKMLVKPEDKIFRRLDAAEKATLRVQGLTQQLLTFSMGGAPVKRVTSIAELIEESTTFALGGSNIRCEYSIDKDLWPVKADEMQISQVISNLIINAQQAMPEGGIIKVRAENITLDKSNPFTLSGGRYLKISIEDHGIGIPEEYLPKIFDPYFTTKQKGSGLGLTATYSIIKNHAGHITVESELGVGTTFYIYLPASEEQALIKKKAEEGPIAGNGKILVMDDEAGIRESITEALTFLGYEVSLAEDGAKAIELYKKARESGNPFSAVIMDLTIAGGMGGKETIKKLFEIDPEVKSIVSSGYSNDPVMSDFREYGFRDVIIKPYKIEDLSRVLHRVITGQS